MPIVYPARSEQSAKVYSREFQTSERYGLSWQSVLRATKESHSPFTCLCNPDHGLRLAVRFYSASNSFSLARYPGTGYLHRNDCAYYTADLQSGGLQAYTDDVVVVDSNGKYLVKYELPISSRLTTSEPSDEATEQSSSSAGGSHAKMTSLGLLHLLWELSGYNKWRPGFKGKRTFSGLHAHLRSAAQSVRIAKLPVSNVLLVAAPFAEGAQRDMNVSALQSAAEQKRRILAIAPLPTRGDIILPNGQLRLRHFHGMPFFRIGKRLWESACHSYQRQMLLRDGQHGEQLIAFIYGERPCKADDSPDAPFVSDVRKLAVMAVTNALIPVESSHEATVARLLVDQDRAFTKPLRYDGGAVLPDFVFDDTDPAGIPMEVFGMADEAYVARRQEKIRHYDQEFGAGHWWSWDAISDQPIPAFPAPAMRRV